MSSTNYTKNLKLPQFLASDKPSWLGDVNGAMSSIDDAYATQNANITKANDTAANAKSQSDANTVTLGQVNTELENHGNRLTALEAGGGTEEIESRLSTVEQNVESLGTRADTFEEEIAENGNKITANKKAVTELTPRVKANEDAVTRIDASVNGHSESIAGLTTKVDKNAADIVTANSNITTARNTANEASSKADQNYNYITALTGRVGALESAGGLSILTGRAKSPSGLGSTQFDCYIVLVSGNTGTLIISCGYWPRSITSVPSAAFDIVLDRNIASINTIADVRTTGSRGLTFSGTVSGNRATISISTSLGTLDVIANRCYVLPNFINFA